MRFGNWRGVTLAIGWVPAAALALCLSSTPTPARADGFHGHTIPDLVPAVDLNTGGPYYAPPIPYGHYAGKNYGGRICSRVRGLLGRGCGLCGGAGCGACGGGGGGLFHHNKGCGDPGCGGACGGGHGGLFGKHHRGGLGSGCGLCGGAGCGSCIGHASTVVASGQGVVTPAPQGALPCADSGCGLGGKGCGLFGKGCGTGDPGCGAGNPCGACGGKGCGLCKGGLGLGGLCKGCGGKGCGLCRGLLGRLLGHNRVEYFVGPGGPVPLTPGYVPYVNVTRSPRDFLAFPPYVP
jgi:hypothetical protein